MIRILCIISYILQYSRYNYIFFENFKASIYKTVGRLIETIPIAWIAFALSYNKNILDELESSTYKSIFYSSIILFFIYKYDIFVHIDRHYFFSGIDKSIFAIFSFIVFYLLPLGKSSERVKLFIKYITSYTLGVYCLHNILNKYILINDIKGCILIYLICYLLSFIGSKVVKSSKLKFLFL